MVNRGPRGPVHCTAKDILAISHIHFPLLTPFTYLLMSDGAILVVYKVRTTLCELLSLEEPLFVHSLIMLSLNGYAK